MSRGNQQSGSPNARQVARGCAISHAFNTRSFNASFSRPRLCCGSTQSRQPLRSPAHLGPRRLEARPIARQACVLARLRQREHSACWKRGLRRSLACQLPPDDREFLRRTSSNGIARRGAPQWARSRFQFEWFRQLRWSLSRIKHALEEQVLRAVRERFPETDDEFEIRWESSSGQSIGKAE
jgi:hypothetical protein